MGQESLTLYPAIKHIDRAPLAPVARLPQVPDLLQGVYPGADARAPKARLRLAFLHRAAAIAARDKPREHRDPLLPDELLSTDRRVSRRRRRARERELVVRWIGVGHQ